MSRSIKKGPYVEKALMKRIVEMNKAGNKTVVKTWSRSSTIFPDFVGHTIAVHDGRKHVPVYVDGGHGGSQAGRVRSHPHVPRPLRRQDRRAQVITEGVKRYGNPFPGKGGCPQAELPTSAPRRIAKYVRISSRKVKIVIDLIRGKNVDEALAILHVHPQGGRARGGQGAAISAIANAENNQEHGPSDTCMSRKCTPTPAPR